MRRKIVVLALAAVTSWAVAPMEAEAFGHHRKRGRHHGRSNACCAPVQAVECCQPSVQYHSAAPQYQSAPAPAAGSCCGGSSSGDMGYQGQPMSAGYPAAGGQYYEGGQGQYIQGGGQGYNQAYGQSPGSFNAVQQGANGTASGNLSGGQNGGNVSGGANVGASGNNVGGNAGANVGGQGAGVGAGASVGTGQ